MIKAVQPRKLKALRAGRGRSRFPVECPVCGETEAAGGRKRGEIVEHECEYCGHRQIVEIE